MFKLLNEGKDIEYLTKVLKAHNSQKHSTRFERNIPNEDFNEDHR